MTKGPEAGKDLMSGKSDSVSVAGLILAAGRAQRMGINGPHKLLAEFGGKPLIRRTAETLLASDAKRTAVVVGHRADELSAALSSLDILLVNNPDYLSGMASSIVTGFSIPELTNVDGILVMLADMPLVTTDHINSLTGMFRSANGDAIIRSVCNGTQGNPIILPRSTYELVRGLKGDAGAKDIVAHFKSRVLDVEIGPAAHLDVDTPEAVLAAGGVLKT